MKVQQFVPIRTPQLTFEQQSWATTQTESVEKIAKVWQEHPNHVRICQDQKFGHMQIALIRKDQLERLLKILHDVQNGQTAIQNEIRALFNAVGTVQDLVEANRQDLPADLEQPLSKAVNTIVSSRIFVEASKRQVKPSPLSEEEKFNRAQDC